VVFKPTAVLAKGSPNERALGTIHVHFPLPAKPSRSASKLLARFAQGLCAASRGGKFRAADRLARSLKEHSLVGGTVGLVGHLRAIPRAMAAGFRVLWHDPQPLTQNGQAGYLRCAVSVLWPTKTGGPVLEWPAIHGARRSLGRHRKTIRPQAQEAIASRSVNCGPLSHTASPTSGFDGARSKCGIFRSPKASSALTRPRGRWRRRITCIVGARALFSMHQSRTSVS